MKRLILGFLAVTTLKAHATDYTVTQCDYKKQQEVESSVADYILANNTFDGGNYVLRSAVGVTAVKKDWQKVGAALIYTGKDGTAVTGLHLCTTDADGDSSLREDFQLNEDLNIADLVKKGELTLDLDHDVYMGDEHVAAPGSVLKAKATEVEGDAHLVEIVLDLTLNICDVTELTEEENESDPDCNKVHETIKGSMKLQLPKALRLKQ